MAPSNFMKSVTAMFNKEEADLPITIFKVPLAIASSKPQAYAPQALGLGPLHHFRRQLQHTQTHKLAEAKRIHRGFDAGLGFEELATHVERVAGAASRASYEFYLDVGDDVLAGVMAVDALFLFRLLCSVAVDGEALACSSFPRLFVEPPGRRLSRETVLQEAVMLENQIPIFVLKVVLMIECWKVEERKEIVRGHFPRLLTGFCRAVSPWKIKAVDYPPHMALKHSHVLDLLYHLITLPGSPKPNPDEEERDHKALDEMTEKVSTMVHLSRANTYTRMAGQSQKALDIAKELAPHLKKPIELVQGLLGLPWTDLRDAISAINKQPEQNTVVPRASELQRAGINLLVADHISAVEFIPETATFRLPFVAVHPYSEVLIRNLVAYESMIKPGTEPMVLNRYVELMSGLVESVEDVEVLKSAGIVAKSEAMSVEEVAGMFKGMRKSVERTNTEDLDRNIDGVASFYGGLRCVRARRFVRKWGRVAYSLGRVLVVLSLLVLMAVQAFCSVCECRRFDFKVNASPDLKLLQMISYDKHYHALAKK